MVEDVSFLRNATTDNWEEPSNWNDVKVPQDTDDVVLTGGTSPRLDTSSSISSLAIRDGAKLTVSGSLKISRTVPYPPIPLRHLPASAGYLDDRSGLHCHFNRRSRVST